MVELDQPPILFIDNKSTLSLAKNPNSHGRTKHIETRFHYLRDQVAIGNLLIDYCSTKDHLADISTKARNLCKNEKGHWSHIFLT